jgi:hypothetical protein
MQFTELERFLKSCYNSHIHELFPCKLSMGISSTFSLLAVAFRTQKHLENNKESKKLIIPAGFEE